MRAQTGLLFSRTGRFEVLPDGSILARLPSWRTEVRDAIRAAPRHLRLWDQLQRAWIFRPDPRAARALAEAARAAGVPLDGESAAWVARCMDAPECGPVWAGRGADCVLVWTEGREASALVGLEWVPGASWDRALGCWKVPLKSTSLKRLVERLDLYCRGAPAWLRQEADRTRRQEEETARLASARRETEEAAGLRDAIVKALPEGLSLYPYQVAAVEFIERAGGRALVGDQMGLGKTPVAITWLLLHPEARPAVVFCPGMVRLQWVRELARWAPGESAEVVVATDDVRRLAGEGIRAVAAPSGVASVTVVNYETASRHAEALMKMGPKAVVLDEAHWIKERRAQRTRAVLAVSRRARYVLALSGTPVLNRPIEFYNVLDLLRPGRFGSWWDFARQYCGLHHNGFGWDARGATNLGELAWILRGEGIMIRRTKDEVLSELPPKRRVVLHVELERALSAEVDRAEEEASRALLTEEAKRWLSGAARPPGPAVAALGKLRAALGAAKAVALIPWLAELAADRQVVVFFHHVAPASEVVRGLAASGIRAERLTGMEGASERQSVVDRFQSGEVQVICATYGAAGVGLNLTAASDVVLAEREWVPATEEQAEDRCHRVGQTRGVTVWVAMSDHRVDRALHAVLEEKRDILRAVVDGAARNVQASDALADVARAVLSCARKGDGLGL